jgi:hypothetical protein
VGEERGRASRYEMLDTGLGEKLRSDWSRAAQDLHADRRIDRYSSSNSRYFE